MTFRHGQNFSSITPDFERTMNFTTVSDEKIPYEF